MPLDPTLLALKKCMLITGNGWNHRSVMYGGVANLILVMNIENWESTSLMRCDAPALQEYGGSCMGWPPN